MFMNCFLSVIIVNYEVNKKSKYVKKSGIVFYYGVFFVF